MAHNLQYNCPSLREFLIYNPWIRLHAYPHIRSNKAIDMDRGIQNSIQYSKDNDRGTKIKNLLEVPNWAVFTMKLGEILPWCILYYKKWYSLCRHCYIQINKNIGQKSNRPRIPRLIVHRGIPDWWIALLLHLKVCLLYLPQGHLSENLKVSCLSDFLEIEEAMKWRTIARWAVLNGNECKDSTNHALLLSFRMITNDIISLAFFSGAHESFYFLFAS